MSLVCLLPAPNSMFFHSAFCWCCFHCFVKPFAGSAAFAHAESDSAGGQKNILDHSELPDLSESASLQATHSRGKIQDCCGGLVRPRHRRSCRVVRGRSSVDERDSGVRARRKGLRSVPGNILRRFRDRGYDDGSHLSCHASSGPALFPARDGQRSGRAWEARPARSSGLTRIRITRSSIFQRSSAIQPPWRFRMLTIQITGRPPTPSPNSVFSSGSTWRRTS